MFPSLFAVAASSAKMGSTMGSVPMGSPSVVGYFFEAGFGLAAGIALVVVPIYKLATRTKRVPGEGGKKLVWHR